MRDTGKDTGKEEYRKAGFRTGGMRNRRVAGKERYRKRDAGKEERRKGGMKEIRDEGNSGGLQDWKDSGLEGYMKVRIQE